MHDNLQYKPRRELLQLCRQFGINTGGLQNQQLVTLLRIKLYQDIEGPRVYGSPGNSHRPLNLNSDNPASMADAGDDSVVLEDESEDISQAEDAAQSSPDQLEPEESPSQDSAPVEEGVLEETADVVTEEVTAGEEAVFESDTSSPVEGNLEEPASISEQASGTEAEHEQVQDEAAVGESNAPEENSVEEPVATFSAEEFEGDSSVAEGEPAIQDLADHAGSSSDAVPEEPEASSDETKEETTGETDVGVDTLEESTSLLKTGLDEASKTLEQQNEVQDVSASEASTVEVEPAIQDPAVGSDSSPEAVSEETQASSEETKEETTREADLSEGTLEESPIPEGGLGLEEASENSEQQNEVQDAPASEVSVAEGAPVLEDPAALSDSSPETVPEEPQTPSHDTKEEISGETDSSVRSVDESPTPESILDEASDLEQQDAPTSEARVAEGEPAVQDREIHFDSSLETVPEEPETLSVETKEDATEELDLSVETLKESPIPESRLDEASDNFEQQHELQDAPAPEASVEDGEPALQDPAEASVEDGEPALQDPAVLSDSSPQIVAEVPQTSSDEIREETSEEIESSVRTVEDSPIPESRLDETAEELKQENEVQVACASEASAANSEPVLQDPAVLSNSSPETVPEEPQTSSEESKEETTGETDASVRTLEEPPFTETRLDATSEKLEQENVVQDASLSEASVAEGGPALQDRGVLSDSSPETVPEELETSPVDIREETPEESDLRVGTVEESPITESRLDETPEELEQENKVQDASASEASAADGGPATRDLAFLSGGSSPEPPQTISGEPVLEVAYGETKEDPSVENDASVDTLEETPIPVSRSDGPSEQVEQKRGEQDPSAYDSSAAKGETEDGVQDGGLNPVSTGVPWDDDHVTSIGEGGVEFKDLPATEAVQTDGSSVAERSPVVSRDISITTQHEIIGGSVLDSDVELRGEEVEAEVPETPAEPDLQPVAGIEGSPKVEDQSAVTAGGPHTIDSGPGLQSKVLGDETVGDAQDPDPEAANKHLGDSAPSVLEADPDQSVSLAPDRVPVTSFFASVGQLPKGTIDEEKELTKLDECYSEAGNKFEDYEVTLVESIPALVAQTSRDYLPTGVSGRGTTVNGEHPPPSASDIEVPVSTQSVQSYYQEQTSIPSQPAATTTTNFFQPLLFWLTQVCSSSR